jgi:hypothetical protein
MCWQAVIIGVQRIIETLSPMNANRARNRTAILTQNRTRVDGQSVSPLLVRQHVRKSPFLFYF